MNSTQEECYDMIASPKDRRLEHEYVDQITWALARVQKSGWIGPSLARATCAVISQLVFDNALAFGKAAGENEIELEANTWAMSASMQKLFAKMLELHLKAYFATRAKEGKP